MLLPSLIVVGTIDPPPTAEVNMASIAMAFRHPRTGQWTLRDRALKGVAVPKGTAKPVADYVQAHFAAMGSQWVNPTVICRLSFLPEDRIKITTVPPSRGILFHGGYSAAQLEAAIRKAGLSRATSTTYFSLGRTAIADFRKSKTPTVWLEDGSEIVVARSRVGEIAAALEAEEWLASTSGVRSNPNHVIALEEDRICYRGGRSHPVGDLTPKSRKALSKLPWLALAPRRKINLRAMRTFCHGGEDNEHSHATVRFAAGCEEYIAPKLVPKLWAWIRSTHPTASAPPKI